MTNLESAKAAILAELDHARQGLNYYTAQVEVLETALAALSSVQTEGSKRAQPTRKRKLASKVKKGAAAKPSNVKLPATGKEFWTSLITNEPQSARQLLDAAVKVLEINPSKDDLKKLAQRQANALHMLVKARTISDTGAGRNRRYLK